MTTKYLEHVFGSLKFLIKKAFLASKKDWLGVWNTRIMGKTRKFRLHPLRLTYLFI